MVSKKTFILGIVAIMLIAIASCAKSVKQPETKNETEKLLWFVDKSGYLYYPLDRGHVKFRRENYSETSALLVSKVVFQSTRGNIYGLLVQPKNITEPLPGIVLLPGAGVSKESEIKLAEKISLLGAAVLTIDQRGVGETDGDFNSIENDYKDFLNSREPLQHLMVYDALRSYDLLYSAPFIDPDRIMIAGESLGGRIAIIAAALDKNIKGALVISSAGFDFEMTNDTRVNAFLQSIDPNHYIGLIAPRKLVIIHNSYDKIVPLESALNSFKKADEPKQFVLVNDTNCNHGYCDSMYGGLVEALDYVVEIKSKTLISIPDK